MADMQRKKMKQLLTDLQQSIPHVKRSLLRALSNVQPRHLLDLRLQAFSATSPVSPALSVEPHPENIASS
jgi:tRNA 2-thiocytidine biosynthesis protein TtcA